MSTNVQIEVDEPTADVLQTRAAELGVTVRQGNPRTSRQVTDLVQQDYDVLE